jgi:hypothetical protein
LQSFSKIFASNIYHSSTCGGVLNDCHKRNLYYSSFAVVCRNPHLKLSFYYNICEILEGIAKLMAKGDKFSAAATTQADAGG